MAIKNMAASVLTRLKNQSKEEGIPFQMVLQLLAQEEILRRQKRWHEKDHPDREFKYTPYKDLKKEEQKLDMIAVYKHFSADRGDYEEKRDYSDTINKIIARQEKLFG